MGNSASGHAGILASLFDAYPDALIVSDRTGQIVLANRLATELFCYPVEELIGKHIDTLVPDTVRARHSDYRKAYFKAPRTRPMGTDTELVARRRDGTEVMVEIALSPMVSGGETHVVAAIRGIADFPRVKDALQRARYSEQLARLGRIAADARDPMLLLEQVPALACEALGAETSRVLLLEPDGLHLRVGAGVGLVPGQTVGSRIPVRPGTAAYRVMTTSESLQVDDLREEQRFEVAPALIEAGLLSALGVPLFDRGRTIGTLAVSARGANRFKRRDLQFLEALSSTLTTALQRAESEDALNHALRLRSVGQLTGGIAHDFNNLLTIIRGNLQMLQELPEITRDTYVNELIAAGLRASDRGAQLTAKLLAFSRRQVLRPTRVEVEPMLHSLTGMLHRTFDQRVEITTRIDSPDLAIRVDPSQVESALLNIAINARDAMPRGGRLQFRAWRCSTLPPTARHESDPSEPAGTAPTDYVAISVSDNGSGMTADVRERAFEPFFTTKSQGRGTGLGLSVVYGFVTQSRGAVQIDSSPGRGTTMTLYFPYDTRKPLPPFDPAPAAHELPAGLRALLVEDDPDVRSVTTRMLRSMGCRVTAMPSGERALTLLDAGRAVDFILSDVALGTGIRGTRLAAEARRRRPGLPVLLMSGFSQDLLETDPAFSRNVLLPKPFDRSTLGRALLRALEQQGGPERGQTDHQDGGGASD